MLDRLAFRYPRFPVLHAWIDALTPLEAAEAIEAFAGDRQGRFVCFRDVNGLMLGRRDRALQAVQAQAALVLPDGIPLVWLGRRQGVAVERACGPDVMALVLGRSAQSGLQHLFYGGGPGVAQTLAERMAVRFPGVKIAGVQTPPFHPHTGAEIEALADWINRSGADCVWIGLPSPGQDVLMGTLAERTQATLLGVGAAFDFHAGTIRRAPLWMQRSGLEWLHRLHRNPKRLWRRYLLIVPHFALLMLLGRT
jgi:N-acetylglucosaminyldiphosphoundecaprenol N-acetyl-beta-D-mannosaminyltransferase